MSDVEYLKDLHYAGVHIQCASTGSKYAPDFRRCRHAGKIERIHSHEFDGPLICGCEDLANPI